MKKVVLLIGKTFGHLEQSCFFKENFSITDGKPPEVNLTNEKNNGESVLKLIKTFSNISYMMYQMVVYYIALSEMALGTDLGLKIQKPKKLEI